MTQGADACTVGEMSSAMARGTCLHSHGAKCGVAVRLASGDREPSIVYAYLQSSSRTSRAIFVANAFTASYQVHCINNNNDNKSVAVIHQMFFAVWQLQTRSGSRHRGRDHLTWRHGCIEIAPFPQRLEEPQVDTQPRKHAILHAGSPTGCTAVPGTCCHHAPPATRAAAGLHCKHDAWAMHNGSMYVNVMLL
jgi:hypothetical protein